MFVLGIIAVSARGPDGEPYDSLILRTYGDGRLHMLGSVPAIDRCRQACAPERSGLNSTPLHVHANLGFPPVICTCFQGLANLLPMAIRSYKLTLCHQSRRGQGVTKSCRRVLTLTGPQVAEPPRWTTNVIVDFVPTKNPI